MEGILTPALTFVSSAAANGAARFQGATDSRDGTDWPEAFFIAVAIAFGCTLVAVIVWQVFLTARRAIDSKAAKDTTEEMRALTQRALAANEATANELAQISQNVTDLRVRLAEIEKVLREVE